MDSFTLSDLLRRFRNMVRKGVVHSVQMSPPRCRVTFGIDPETGKEHITGWLMWAAQADAEKQTWSVPAIGASVTVLSEGGDLRQGIVYPGGITDDKTPASDSPHEHITRYYDGATFSYDTASHAAEINLPEGGTVKVTGPGGIELDGEVVITKGLTVKADLHVVGDITDNDGNNGSLQDLREVYDDHDHNENGDGGGITDPPNQPSRQTEPEPEPDP